MRSSLLLAILLFFGPCAFVLGGTNSENSDRALLEFESPLVAPTARDTIEDKKLAITLPGMGTAFSWNFGSLHAMYEALEPVRNNQVILAGNSGGAVPALYFSCRGFSPQSIRDAERLVLSFSPEIANEEQYQKLVRLFLKVATEFPDGPLLKHIEEVIPLDCRPNLPFIIPVGNAEVIERRLTVWPHSDIDLFSLLRLPTLPRPPRPLVGTRDLRRRRLDQYTYWVNELPEPGSQEATKPIGKACTYLVSPSMFERLRKVDEATRLCDLRLIEDGEDMRFAMRLAVGEATYYDPLGEDPSYFTHKKISQQSLMDQGKLIISKAERDRGPFQRLYNGGLMMPGSVGRELVAIDPDIKILSSGRPYFYDTNVVDKVNIPHGIKAAIEKVNPEYAAYLRPKLDANGNPENDKSGNPWWTLPPDGQGLFLRNWYGYDVNKLVYLDQHLVDVAVRVDHALVAVGKRGGKERKADLQGEIHQGYEATWRCLAPDVNGRAVCPPRGPETIPPLTEPPAHLQAESTAPPSQPIRDLGLRPEGWRPRLELPVIRKELAFPWKT